MLMMMMMMSWWWWCHDDDDDVMMMMMMMSWWWCHDDDVMMMMMMMMSWCHDIMMMMMLMMMMMMTLMKLVISGTKFRPGIDKFYHPNSGCAQFQEVGRGYIYIWYYNIHISSRRHKSLLASFFPSYDGRPHLNLALKALIGPWWAWGLYPGI